MSEQCRLSDVGFFPTPSFPIPVPPRPAALWPGLGLFVDGVDHIGHFALAVPVLLAGDISSFSSSPYRRADGVDAFPVDKDKPFRGIVPIFPAGEHLRCAGPWLSGISPCSAGVVIGHHRVALVTLYEILPCSQLLSLPKCHRVVGGQLAGRDIPA